MTPADFLNEIQKMPFDEKRRIFLELNEQLNQAAEAETDGKEEMFVNGLRRKGLVTEIPLRLPDDETRRRFKRIEVTGEPLSETIIKERG